jgi:hypothetical protein
MKPSTFQFPLLALFLASACLCAEVFDSHSILFREFRTRVEAAIQSRNLDNVVALYQTNGIAAQEIKLELVRWRPILAQQDDKVVAFFFKELSTLPPTARQVWGEQARRLTTHRVTHLVLLHYGDGVRLTLPLVSVNDRLLIVSADQDKVDKSIEPAAGGNAE